MTQDEIIEMAEQAGVAFSSDDYPDIWGVHMHVGKQELVAFAHLVADKATDEANATANASWTLMCKKMVAIEREACAKVVDDIELRCIAKDVDDPPLKHVAAAIRARGQA
jgi:hypothetical protein